MSAAVISSMKDDIAELRARIIELEKKNSEPKDAEPKEEAEAMDAEAMDSEPKKPIIQVDTHNPKIISARVEKDHAKFYSSNKEQTEWFVSLSNTGCLYLSRDKGRTYYMLDRCSKLPPVRFNDKALKITINSTNKLVFFEQSDYDETKKMFKVYYP